MSGSSGQASARWQYTLAVRGQVSAALRMSTPSGKGRRMRNCSWESGSGLRAMTKVDAVARGVSGRDTVTPPVGAGGGQVLVEQFEILVDDSGGHASEQGQFF